MEIYRIRKCCAPRGIHYQEVHISVLVLLEANNGTRVSRMLENEGHAICGEHGARASQCLVHSRLLMLLGDIYPVVVWR